MNEVIDWPEELKKDPYKSRFLTGFPYFGPHTKILKNAKSILKKRSKQDVDRLWTVFYSEIPPQNIIEDIYKIADEYLKWPNHLFLPSDNASIVFGFIPGIWIEPEDVTKEICKKIKVRGTDTFCELFESIEKDNLLAFFKCLKKVIEEKKENKERESSRWTGIKLFFTRG